MAADDVLGYAFEPEDFAKLRVVEKRLYGDGRRLSEDARRDLANFLNVILSRAIPLNDDFIVVRSPSKLIPP